MLATVLQPTSLLEVERGQWTVDVAARAEEWTDERTKEEMECEWIGASNSRDAWGDVREGRERYERLTGEV